jgi:hypothetical protein
MAPEMGKRRLMLILEVWRNHLRLNGAFVTVWGSTFHIFVVVVVCAAAKIAGTFVFIWTTML